MKTYTKPGLTIEQQIQILKDRGLKFNDEKNAFHLLSNISFYRLRAYTYPFQDNRDCNHTFTYEISFEEIIDIYIFDRKLRLLVFDAIEKIEISLRTKIIYNISLDKGGHWFQKQDCFNNQKIFKKDLASLKRELRRSTETFIKHYNKIYDKPKLPPA